MNRYKITYIVDEGETETAYITERTEAAARKVSTKPPRACGLTTSFSNYLRTKPSARL